MYCSVQLSVPRVVWKKRTLKPWLHLWISKQALKLPLKDKMILFFISRIWAFQAFVLLTIWKPGTIYNMPFSRCPEPFKCDSWKLDKHSQMQDAYRSAMFELYFHKQIKFMNAGVLHILHNCFAFSSNLTYTWSTVDVHYTFLYISYRFLWNISFCGISYIYFNWNFVSWIIDWSCILIYWMICILCHYDVNLCNCFIL